MARSKLPGLGSLGEEPGNSGFFKCRQQLEKGAPARIGAREGGNEPEDEGELECFGIPPAAGRTGF